MLQIIRGRAKSGKSQYCIDRMKEIVGDNEKVFMIVPEQFSYAAEKRLVEQIGGAGINNCEVITFARLAHRILYKTVTGEYIKPAGKQMILYKAVEMIKKENSIFEKSISKAGFLTVLSGVISEMKRYCIDCNLLIDKADKLPEGMLKRKIDAISKVYENYTNMVDERFIDSDDDLDRVAFAIKNNIEFLNTHIFIDEFSDFLPTHYKVISALMEKAKSVSVTLCMDKVEDSYSSFVPCIKSLYRLKDLANEVGCDVLPDIFLKDKGEVVKESTNMSAIIGCPIDKRYNSNELRFLEENFDDIGIKAYNDKVDAISLFLARDIYSETERLAAQILHLVRENNMRFRDISVLCGDLDSYHHIIEVLFSAYEIPYFTDKKIAVINHPILRLILSIFDIFSQGFNYDSIFEYLRSGFINISDDEIDSLENYVLKKGIRGKKAWMSDKAWINNNYRAFDAVFDRDEEDEDDNSIDEIRKKVITPFIEFEKNFDGRKTIRQICTALFEFLDSGIGLATKLDEFVDSFISEGRLSEAEQFRQVWNILMDVLDQLVTAMGDDYSGMERFGELIKIGLSEYKIGIVPSSVDQVSIGTVDRSKSTSVKVLFVIGAVYGKIPGTDKTEGILSDRDRKILQDNGLEFAPDIKTKIMQEKFKIYKALTIATDKLIISYPVSDSEGKALRPAQFVSDLNKMFPNLPVSDNLLRNEYNESYFALTKETAFNHMVMALSSGEEYNCVWDKVYEWYQKNDDWQDKLKIVEMARKYKKSRTEITKENVDKLYKDNEVYSVSRLETFSQCYFKYFLEYGLKAQPREVWRIESFDIGNLMHYMLQCFCQRVEDGKKDDTLAEIKKAWHEIDNEKCDKIISDLMKEAKAKILSGQIQGAGRIKFLLNQIEKTLRRCVEMIKESLQNSEFAAVGYEKRFYDYEIEGENGEKVKLRGIIDRIDLLEEDDKVYIRIIDYKSGYKKFDLENIFNSLDMQLLVYAQAAVKLYQDGKLVRKSNKQVQLAGVLYCTLRDPMVSFSGPSDVDIDKIRGMSKLSGLLLEDMELLRKMDTQFAKENIDDLLANGVKKKDINLTQESSFLPVKTVKSGELSSKSSTANSKNIDNLLKYVNKSIVEIDKKIMDGCIDVLPLKESEQMNACVYCPYGEACQFGNGDTYRLVKKFNDSPWTEFDKAVNGEKEGK